MAPAANQCTRCATFRLVKDSFLRTSSSNCPICLTEFTEPDVRAGEVVTLEHAPQESVGGKPACLTCMQCNTGPATGMIDRAVARYHRAQEQGGPLTGTGDSQRHLSHR